MTYTEKMLTSIREDTDFATTLKLMLKLDSIVITTQSLDDVQCIYVVGARETVLYQFYGYTIFERAIKPYGSKPTMCVSSVKDLLAELLTFEGLTVTIHT